MPFTYPSRTPFTRSLNPTDIAGVIFSYDRPLARITFASSSGDKYCFEGNHADAGMMALDLLHAATNNISAEISLDSSRRIDGAALVRAICIGHIQTFRPSRPPLSPPQKGVKQVWSDDSNLCPDRIDCKITDAENAEIIFGRKAEIFYYAGRLDEVGDVLLTLLHAKSTGVPIHVGYKWVVSDPLNRHVRYVDVNSPHDIRPTPDPWRIDLKRYNTPRPV
jgi:hypothetical protein